MTNSLAYRNNERGSGRTSRLLKALPSGSYFVVAHTNMVPMFKDYMKSLGREGEITFVSINSPYWMRGRSNVIVAIDHFALETATQKQIQELYQGLIPCGSMVMTCDYEGDVITTLNNFMAPVYQNQPALSDIPLVEPTIETKFKALFGRFWPL